MKRALGFAIVEEIFPYCVVLRTSKRTVFVECQGCINYLRLLPNMQSRKSVAKSHRWLHIVPEEIR
jgi:hypothetical protein